MAISINLLHEEQQEVIARRKDPFKIGMLFVLLIAIGLAAYYFMKAGEWREIKNSKLSLESEWARKEPLQTEAAAKQLQLEEIIAMVDALKGFSENRFYWAPFLESIHQTINVDASLKAFSGTVNPSGAVVCSLSGIIVGDSPRQSAENLRRTLETRLAIPYQNVNARFTSLEEEGQEYLFQGKETPAANFVIELTFDFPLKMEKVEVPVQE